MTLRQLTDLGLKAKLFALAGTVTSIIALAATVAQADVSNAGVCRFRAHLQMDAGSYRTTGSTVSCSGTLAGQPVTNGGTVEMWGHYVESWSADSGCTVAWRDGVFDARIKEAAAFFDSGDLSSEGGFDIAGGPVMQVTGTGDTDYKPFIEQGSATFTPDTGQSCGSLRSGTLIQRVTLTDGGAGNAAAEEEVGQYEAQEWGTEPSPGSRHRHKHRPACHHHRKHRCRHRAR